VDDLEVNNELTATVVDDKGTDRATAVGKGIADALGQTTLGDNGEGLLDVTGLGHGGEGTVTVDVEDTVGLEDGAEHGLDNHGRRGVGDEARLLLQLAGEEVNTEVTVLASLGRDRDADHLARTALEDQDVADANEVAGDGDSLAGSATVAGLNDTDSLTGSIVTGTGLNDLIATFKGVSEVVGNTLHAAAEGVVLTLVVVVTHLASLLGSGSGNGSRSRGLRASRNVSDGSLRVLNVDRGVTRRLLNLDLATSIVFALVNAGGVTLVGAVVRVIGNRARLLVLERFYGVTTLVRGVDVVVGRGTLTVVSLSDVELGIDDGLIVDLGTFLETNRRLLAGVAKEKK
jgi:hypothetical protein